MKSGLCCLILICVGISAHGQSWKEDLEIFPKTQTIQTKGGYRIHRAPGGPVIKEVDANESINVKAALDYGDERYYISDWSWNRHLRGAAPNWIALINPPAGTTADSTKAKAAEALALSRGTPAAKPGTAEYRLEQEWGGLVEVFPSLKDIAAPDGHDIRATPREGAKILKRVTRRSTVGAMASISFDSGEIYYASGWSWDRAKKGYDPNWIRIEGHSCKISSSPSSPFVDTFPEGKATPALPALPRIKAEAPSGRVLVLLIANGRYSSINPGHQQLDLTHPRKDVELLATRFRQRQAEVRVLRDLKQRAMKEAIDQAIATLEPGDVFLFYYSGHGLQVGSKNYLAPLDISFLDHDAVRSTAISVDEMLNTLSRTDVRLSSIILDASWNNPYNTVTTSTHLARFFPALRSSARTGKGLAEIKAPENTVIAFSAAPGKSAPSPPRVSGHSPYAKALAEALKPESVEIREALDHAAKLVRSWTANGQQPWRAEGNAPRFFPQFPSRQIAAPDEFTREAGQWLAQGGVTGIPMAMGHLARSVRNQPEDNPATAALLYLLSHQAVPVPLHSWGPFRVANAEYSPDLQISINGRYFGLFKPDHRDPSFILDRETGRTVTSIEDSFMPQDDAALTSSRSTGDKVASLHGEPVSIWTVQREAWGAEDRGDEPDPNAITPVLRKGAILASHFDDGLERAYLVTREKSGVYLYEYAVTPAVSTNLDMARRARQPDPAKAGKTESLLTGKTSTSQDWELIVHSSGEVRLTLDQLQTIYRRKGARTEGTQLDDWLADRQGDRIILLYRNGLEIVSLKGGTNPSQPASWPKHHRSAILGFSAPFQRLVTASWDEEKDPRNARIEIIDLTRAEAIREEGPLEGYPHFAALSPDSEWFLFYDKNRRLRMIDIATGGSMLDLPATRAPMPLPLPGSKTEADSFFAPAFQAPVPPLLAKITDHYTAPAWLADLAESIAGFRIANDDGEVEWLKDAPKSLRETARQMKRRGRNESQDSWAEWFRSNRLAALDF